MNTLALALALAFSAPPPGPPDVRLEDLDRFPPDALVEAYGAFLNAHLSWLERQIQLHAWDRDNWLDYELEVKFRRRVWQGVEWARWYRSKIKDWKGYRESALEELRWVRWALGPVAYELGVMPPPVPVEFFQIND